MSKKGDTFRLNKKYYKNISAYIIGLSKNFFMSEFKNKIKFKYLKYLKKTVLKIREEIKSDTKLKIILFSPAAASFDQFNNFEDRGKYYNELKKKLFKKKYD